MLGPRQREPVQLCRMTPGVRVLLTTASSRCCCCARLQGGHVLEVVISTTSPFVGQSERDADFGEKYQLTVLGACHRGQQDSVQAIDLDDAKLRTGDTVLVLANEAQVAALKSEPDFVLALDVHSIRDPVRPWDYVPVAMFLTMLILGASIIVRPLVRAAGHLSEARALWALRRQPPWSLPLATRRSRWTSWPC
jgi:hypothetical protein